MKTTAFCIGAVALLLIGCAPEIETPEASTELPPALAPDIGAGDVFVHLNKVSGEEETSRILAVDGDVVHMVNETTGCSFKYLNGAYAPTLEWENCDGASGVNTVEGEATLFPLEVGKTETWEVVGRNDRGETWRTVQTCEVVGAPNVTVAAGSFETYHIRCEDTWWVYERYFALELGRTVLFRQNHKSSGDFRHRELVSYTPAA